LIAAAGLGLAAAVVLGEGVVRLAARWSPAVRALAVPREGRPLPAFPSLEAYLASQPTHVVPHRNWFNYWNNALGMNDDEFAVPKPAGRFRIMAVGDSFTYGLVPYPDAVMTVLEARLRTGCRGKDLDVLNFGIAGARVEDYRTLVTLGVATYAPDLVVIHFYAGNDGPDLYRLVHERSRWAALLGHSRLWTFTDNVIRSRRDVDDAMRAVGGRPARLEPGGPPPRGGAVVDPRDREREDDAALVGPTFGAKAFDSILAEELRRLYSPPDPAILDRAWQPEIEALEAIREHVSRGQGRLALVVYPSALQVDPTLRAQLVPRLRQRARYAALTLDAIDPGLPQTRLAAYCQRVGLPCFDLTPALVAAHRAAPEAPLYKQRDSHWTIRGNRVAAEAAAAHLVGLVCPGTQTGRAGAAVSRSRAGADLLRVGSRGNGQGRR
jgi:hypothetical protein